MSPGYYTVKFTLFTAVHAWAVPGCCFLVGVVSERVPVAGSSQRLPARLAGGHKSPGQPGEQALQIVSLSTCRDTRAANQEIRKHSDQPIRKHSRVLETQQLTRLPGSTQPQIQLEQARHTCFAGDPVPSLKRCTVIYLFWV